MTELLFRRGRCGVVEVRWGGVVDRRCWGGLGVFFEKQ